jgi:antitoxin HicB
MIHYPALFEPDAGKGGFVVTFPDFGWGVTQGESESDAIEMAADALICIIEETIRQRKDLPRPSKLRGKKYREIAVPALADAKIQIYEAMRAGRVQKAELARRMGIPRQQIERLLDLQHSSRLEQIEAAFRALNKRLVVSTEDAA